MDDSLGCLMTLVWLPYELWSFFRGRSVLGESRMDRENGRFWFNFAWIGTLGLVAAGLLIAWFWK